MSPYVPSAARRKRRPETSDDDESLSPRSQLQLSSRILEQVQVPKLGRPPKDDDEKREVFSSLAYLKSAGKTHKECAEALDVSERTIGNYLADPLYLQVQQEMQGQARSQGHTTISFLIDDALSEIYNLMKGANSEFVRFKSAETLLNFAGYNQPRETKPAENKDDLARFFQALNDREQQRLVQVNVSVTSVPRTGADQDTPTVVEALPAPSPVSVSGDATETLRDCDTVPSQALDLAFYERPVLPGGKLPSMHPASLPEDDQLRPTGS